MSEKAEDLDAAMQALLEEELVMAGSVQAGACGAQARASAAVTSAAAENAAPQGDAAGAFRQTLAGIAAEVLKIPPDRLDPREAMSRYGVDSIIVTEIMRRISDRLSLPIAPTVFFEARHLDELADILFARYGAAARLASSAEDMPAEVQGRPGQASLAEDEIEDNPDAARWIAKFQAIAGQAVPPPPQPRSATGYEPIAILAMDGAFAESATLDDLARHLARGDDCIREVPPARWDWRAVDGDPKQGEWTNVRYGGFAPDVDLFDPLFFGMSAREAELMDPQHRMFIQCVWRTIEMAGYAPRALQGRKIGLFLGINLQDYAHLIDRAGAIEAAHLTSLGHMFCPNRLSFLLDIHGPSQVIDTACSSSLVALHRAVLALQHEGCEMAIAGGANLMLSPDMHIMYSKLGMICADGRCKTFSNAANGYARGDGVGAVLLKPLAQAERDGDPILAVIRGSAENHGGLSTSLTAPNPRAQARLIVEAHRRAGTDPRSVGYIECHGTGTALGDPIEVNGLKMAFEELYGSAGLAMPERAACGLGSVKSNIGHAETAAGIAGVIKTVLALRHRRLYRTLHADALNPMLALEGSPFFVLQEGQAWEAPVVDGTVLPRRAGVSSFGAGGSNAHVVIEEYAGRRPQPASAAAPALIVLSAKSEERLGAVVRDLHAFLERIDGDEAETPRLSDIAYTLQVGRDAMAHRVALVVASLAELKDRLALLGEGPADAVPACVQGVARRKGGAMQAGDGGVAPGTLAQLIADRDLTRLAALWVEGVEIDWTRLYADADVARPRRVSLPAYPFARQRHWLPGAVAGRPEGRRQRAEAVLHPLCQQNVSSLDGVRFSSVLTGREAFLADHVVMGEKVLPGVAYLEMARAAAAAVRPAAMADGSRFRLSNVVWARPFVVGDRAARLSIALTPADGDRVAYRIVSSEDGGTEALHSQGTVAFRIDRDDDAERLDLEALRARIGGAGSERDCLAATACYAAFRAMGISYGPSHQGLQRVAFAAGEGGRPEVLAEIAVPAAGNNADAYVLAPGLMDSALQACIGLVAAGGGLPNGDEPGVPQAALPFGLDRLDVLGPLSERMWVWVRHANDRVAHERLQKLDIDICDAEGRIVVRLRGFSSRSSAPAERSAVLISHPAWREAQAALPSPASAWARHRIALCDLHGALREGLRHEIERAIPGATCLRIPLGGDTAQWYGEATARVLRLLKDELLDKKEPRTLVQVVVPAEGDGALLEGLAGLVKTVNRESTRVVAQLFAVDAGAQAGLAARLATEAGSGEAHVRLRAGVREALCWEEAALPAAGAVPWKDNGVYLVTGGSGGLGALFARAIATATRRATVILCGRSAPGPQHSDLIDALVSAGLDAHYRQADVTRRADVEAVVGDLLRTYGRLDGVLHCAGLLRDNFLARKPLDEVAEVLAPKVSGTLHLDAATADVDLDVFALFSSAAGAFGSAGQADYAAANAFLDAFAHRRQSQVAAGQRRGRTVSIDWPLWAGGGMRMEPASLAMMRQSTGMEPLPDDVGLAAFGSILASGVAQASVLYGQPDRLKAMLAPPVPVAADVPEPDDKAADAPTVASSALQGRVAEILLGLVGRLTKFDLSDLDADAEWSDYGFDSISLTDFANQLNQGYRLDLAPTVFFEHPTVAELARWLAEAHAGALSRALGISEAPRPARAPAAPAIEAVEADPPSVQPKRAADRAVAVVGMSGRFPMAPDLDAFWDNLVAGRDCITEIPEDRWDWRALDEETTVKWGGFIAGIGDFDARFFNISPREAELMDPAQRLLLIHAWKAIEDAGYAPRSLWGSRTGVFVGTAPSGYGALAARSGAAIESLSATGEVGSIGPNRLSYLLNLTGPSEPVETACSSSLVAIHRALQAIANGDCDQAIVGGINLILSPETHISFSKAGMLSPDGRCKAFAEGANGYVRGEGVGMLFLKPLAAAEAAGDPIHGVIRVSAENHGGRANALTAPNPKAQAALIKDAYAKAGIDPGTVGYVEAHGTGTSLGDPIEFAGLTAAFRDLAAEHGTREMPVSRCGLGSVKTNIGHLELAAGIAGVIKVLLQLKHRTLAASLHCETVNPHIRLEESPFHLVRQSRPWEALIDMGGRTLPRRAGVSSFGFGGVNAHVLIEEYRAPEDAVARRWPTSHAAAPLLFVLSARNADRLQAYAADVRAFVAARCGGRRAEVATNGSSLPDVLQTTRTLAAEILGVEPADLAPDQPLDAYGFDRVHRTLLHERLAESLGVDIAGRVFFDHHTLAEIAEAVAERAPGAMPASDAEPSLALADLVYTLQVGRAAMDARLAFSVRSLAELDEKLGAFLESTSPRDDALHVGQRSKALAAALGADLDLGAAIARWVESGQTGKLLDLWVQGLDVDWAQLYGAGRCYPVVPRRISAPGYPFAAQRHWIVTQGTAARSASVAEVSAAAPLHPLLHRNVSGLSGVRFATHLSGREFFLADHRVKGQRVLPGVAYLEMARAAVALASSEGADAADPGAVTVLRDVAWISPAVVEQPLDVAISLTPGAEGAVRFEIASGARAAQPAHSQGTVGQIVRPRPARIDAARLAAQAGMTRHDARDCYALFETCGLSYGPGHQGIVALHASRDSALAELALPASVLETRGQYVLHPAILDSALQASIGLMLAAGPEGRGPASPKLALPFAVEEVAVYGRSAQARWAWVRPAAGGGRSDRIQKLDIDVADEAGEVLVAIRGFSSRLLDVAPGEARTSAEPAARTRVEVHALRGKTVGYLKEHLSVVLKFPVEDIHEGEPLDSYGIDSMLVVELTGRLESALGPLSKTLFFEHGTLGELVDHLVEAYRPQLLKCFDGDLHASARAMEETRPEPVAAAPAVRPAPAVKAAVAGPSPSSSALDIAIIGVSGRYPEAPDVEAYWRNLRDGRDCITEVPPERWNWRAYYGADGTAPGRHTCKWGGFIAEADKFDPLFFNISPTTAEYMDPQERLFLEHAWMAMEDAGYRREDLSAPGGHTGDEDEETAAQVGVYAGVMYGEYQLLACEASLVGRGAPSTNFYASVANRVSYALNLQGPSLAVDTMCSSSLTAIHIACLDLKLGRTDMALAGGVNLSLHPKKYELLSAGQFISTQGKCHSFGAGGDGYVPSEGVGVVLLKRLADAERDGDRIYGVIKASALNHGGKTNGYSVPNPKAQQAVISRALREAQIDARAYGYVEAHGTGTRLGDPIEIAGLGRALARHFAPGQRCWIGSSKSNIGHSEAAAGIAGLTKVLMQMRERQIAPSLHSAELNANIDFSATPFAVNQVLRDWPQPVADGRPLRRVAGISSFGAGGANAHVIVEEYPGAEPWPAPRRDAADAPCAIVLSARTEAQLAAYAERLASFVRERDGDARRMPALRDLAFTLQVGREAMPYRLGFVARSLTDVTETLQAFLVGDRSRVRVGRAGAGGRVPLGTQADPAAMLKDWIDGAAVDWRRLYDGRDPKPARISLPTYPFARERYWMAELVSRVPTDAVALSAPPVARAAAAPEDDAGADVLTLRPAWVAQEIDSGAAPPDYGAHRVFALADLPEMPVIAAERLRSGAAGADACFSDYAVQLFAAIKEILAGKPTAPVLVQVVVGSGGDGRDCPAQLCAALAGMLKTARLENPRLVGQLIEIDGALAALGGGALADVLRSNGRMPSAVHVRYRSGRREVSVLAEVDAQMRGARPVWREGGSYLVTGGAGGLGLIFAREIVRQVKGVRLVLTGRSEANAACRAAVAALAAEGADVRYRAVDVSDRGQVAALVASIGPLHGIVHSAGVLRDAYMLKKTVEDVRAVLAPKVAGVVNLDLATRGLDLDFLALFASLAGVSGNPGQADYATANAFLDGYAAYRNRLAREGADDVPQHLRPRGVTVSIDWPLWRDGGMQLDAAARDAMWRAAGLRPLETEAGLAAFSASLAAGGDQAVVLQGDLARVRTLFLPASTQVRGMPPGPVAATEASPAQTGSDAGAARLVSETGKWVARTLSDLLKLPLHRLEGDVPLDTYGIDSVAMMRITAELEKVVGPLSKTLLFEHPTIDAVSGHLAETCAPALTQFFGPGEDIKVEPREEPRVTRRAADAAPLPPVIQEPIRPAARAASSPAEISDIAVIGMAGRFPCAPDVDTFWENLITGRDCITEVPAERWDHSTYFDAEKGRAGKTYCKWGGFLDGVDGFDHDFFRISAREAELLDPQERLFLETAWELLEAAGYLGETLQRLSQSRVGVFVGSMSQQYHALRSDVTRESLVMMSTPSSIANRVSYFFNFQGPSLTIDTACSSSLNAVHLACESLRAGGCKVAIAGGVNLTIHPKKYLALAISEMAGSHPGSRSFADGDGYLPAEAVGAVLLKPLPRAMADGDAILGVIKSTAVNHGGQSAGYRVPNGQAQAELMAGNFARAGIDPRTVSYVEAAANGAPLGDAIEVGALASVFGRAGAAPQSCVIGSVKASIGHAEAASGISQLIKVLLQMRHRRIAPTIKATPSNPNIDFTGTPFRLAREPVSWSRPKLALDGGPAEIYPRRAAVSSFGLGGSNAHLLVEEYLADDAAPADDRREAGPHLILLSAKTARQRAAQARLLLAYLAEHPDVAMADVAFTLQTSRETLAYRLALVAEDRDGAMRLLAAHLAGERPAGVYLGDAEQDTSHVRALLSGRTGEATLALLMAERDLDKLAMYWVGGARISWQALNDGAVRRRIALPAYPFDRRRHWLAETALHEAEAEVVLASAERSHPVDGADVAAYLMQRIAALLGIPSSRVRRDQAFLDHGLDSILLTRLRRDAEKAFGVGLSARDLFDHPTPAALAALIAARRRDDGSEAARSCAVDGVAEELPETMPLSEGQKALWLLQRIAPEMGAYNVPLVLRLGPAIDLEILRQAFAHVLRQFPALRAVFREVDGVPAQTVLADLPLRFDVETMAPASQDEILAQLRARSKEPFDLAQGPLLRVRVLSPDEGPRYVLIVVHHIVFDGLSGVLLVRALAEAYVALAAGEPPVVPDARAGYGDFVRWQRDLMQSPRGGAQLRYWQERLAGPLSMLPLPFDRGRPAAPGFNGASQEVVVGEAEARAVRTLARTARVSVSTVFLGALKLLLHRYSGETDVIVGMPTLGRPEPRFETVVGYFVNMIAVRTRAFGDVDTVRFLSRLQATVAEGLDNAEYPFPALLGALDIDRGQARSPLTQVLFSYQNFIRPDDRAAADRASEGDHAMALVAGVNQEGGHDLALDVYEADSGFRLILSYDRDLFDAETIRRAAQHYVRLLDGMASAPDAPLSAHGLLSEDERRLLEDWSAGSEARVAAESVVDLIAQQAMRTPDAPAVWFQDDVLSYAALAEGSARLAGALRARGLDAGARVGVCLSRGPGLVVAMLAIWRVGGVYVPVAPDCPAERIAALMSDCEAALLLVDAATRPRCAAAGVPLLSLDAEAGAEEADAPPVPPYRADAPAYVIYTSGSTGRPKGVVVSQGALAQHCQVMRDVYRLVPEDRILHFASAAVDASLEQILPGLIAGAAIVVRPDPLWSVSAFCREVDRFGVTVIDVPPSYLHEVLHDAPDADTLKSVRLVITGGEALTPETVALWKTSALAACRFVNAYGPTETTITSLVHEVGADAGGPIPIGRPLPGEQAVILDAYGEPAPVGVPGELYLGGGGLAIGYLNQSEATQAAFVESPAVPGQRLYRTGDAACWRADGTIAFLGRRDHQVKVRGYRVECGEVEAAVRALDGVRDAAVVHRAADGHPQLVAFVVPRDEAVLTPEGLRQALARVLPGFMLPAHFVMLSEMPQTPGGKADRQALSRWRIDAEARETYVPPRTEIEARLVDVWQRVLGRARVGVLDNFFDLGGHSLLAVRLGTEIRKTLGREISIASLFVAPDIARQAVLLAADGAARSPLVMLERGGAGATVFLVHAVSGTVFSYRALARALGERHPVCALESPEASRHPGSVEGLAALYVAAMRAMQPQGPYHLGGWSMGGVIAFEMARQLEALGEKVAMLALIDSYTPDAARAVAGALDDEETLRRAFGQEMSASGVTSSDAEALFPVYRANVSAMHRYAPGRYSGRASLLVAEAPAADAARHGDWDARVSGGLSTLTVPGDHHTLLAPPNVAALADRLMQLMEEAGAA